MSAIRCFAREGRVQVLELRASILGALGGPNPLEPRIQEDRLSQSRAPLPLGGQLRASNGPVLVSFMIEAAY